MPELTPIQTQILAGLLAGKSVSAAARENGIHRSTIYQWRNENPRFMLTLDRARARQRTVMFDLVQDLAEQALDSVAELLASPDLNLRLRAAQLVLRVAEPCRLSRDPRSAEEFEVLADGVKSEWERELVDTIRHNPTLSS